MNTEKHKVIISTQSQNPGIKEEMKKQTGPIKQIAPSWSRGFIFFVSADPGTIVKAAVTN
jgi:hypothetical protein